LNNYINKTYNRHKGLKTTKESCFILRHKLSFDILIQFLIIEDISQYPKN